MLHTTTQPFPVCSSELRPVTADLNKMYSESIKKKENVLRPEIDVLGRHGRRGLRDEDRFCGGYSIAYIALYCFCSWSFHLRWRLHDIHCRSSESGAKTMFLRVGSSAFSISADSSRSAAAPSVLIRNTDSTVRNKQYCRKGVAGVSASTLRFPQSSVLPAVLSVICLVYNSSCGLVLGQLLIQIESCRVGDPL